MAELSPYLSFRGDARAALEFYQDVFGGTLDLTTFGEYGVPDAPADQIMHGQLTMPSGQNLMASDVSAGMDYSGEGRRVTLMLHGEDEAELRGHWDRLSDGGTVEVPLEKQMWGDVYGQCTDRFGIVWMMNIAAPQ